MTDLVPFWINGATHAARSPRTAEVTNPATGKAIRKVALADESDVDRAVRAASAAFSDWSGTPPLRRARVMAKFKELIEVHRDRLAHLITEEHGKTLPDAQGEVQRGLEVVEFASGVPHLQKGEHAEDVGRGIDCHSRLQAIGVCVGITPFNFPVMVPCWMFPVAIACGNTFVLKPSEKDPSASMLLAELLKEAGLPDGVFNVVHGDKVAVDSLLAHPMVRAVSFVGSTPIARYVYETAARHGKRVQALGGAKNHAVVMPDADLDFAADAIAGAGYGSAGERCMAISAVVAVGDIGDALVEKIAKIGAGYKVAGGDTPGADMGPLISKAHRDKVRGYVDSGESEGASLVLDGRTLSVEGHRDGFFLGPTLFDNVSPEMSIYRDEIFGPVLSVVRVNTLDEAIALVNRNDYGNGTAIFTSSGGAARKFENEIEVGMVGVNVPIPVPMAFFSFGGWKQSLFGDLHVHGMEGVYFYTRTKVITERWPSVSAPTASATRSTVMPTHG